MNEQYFYQLKTKIENFEKINQEIEKGNWYSRFDFNMVLLNYTSFLNKNLIMLMVKFKGIPNVIKMEPMSFYNWHTDIGRTCSINCLISGYDSKCLFGKKDNEYTFIDLIELKYQPERLYLLNTKESHAILNCSEPRFVLSIGFKETPYKEILEYCKTHDI